MERDRTLPPLTAFLQDEFKEHSPLASPDKKRILGRLKEMPAKPLTLTHFNQLLHLNHEAGVTEGFFRYYFLHEPKDHPYPLAKVPYDAPPRHSAGISTREQLDWGIKRFLVDALLYWDNARDAYRELRIKSYDEICSLFQSRRFPSDQMQQRGQVLDYCKIEPTDRYLISELACKAYSPGQEPNSTHIEDILVSEYRRAADSRMQISDLIGATPEAYTQLMLQLGAEEYKNKYVGSEDELRAETQAVASRFVSAREAALKNTRLYPSIVNELDVYVATSMRRQDDFCSMARDCMQIFETQDLVGYSVRYFDPTLSATMGHEDKGLLECLMVKCAKVVLYFAGERDSFGKDAEIAMAMSLGKPVIIVCPDTPDGRERERFFKEVHPLSRLIEFNTGIPIGAMVTRDLDVAARLLVRLFSNSMEYDLERGEDGYLRLKERITGSAIRLQSNWRLLREAFWNYYHEEPKKRHIG